MNILYVIISPKYGWEVINESNIPTGTLLSRAYYPLLAILMISCFVPRIYDSTLSFGTLLLNAIVMLATFWVAYYIIIYLLGCSYPELVKTEGATARLHDFILYNLIFLVLINIIINLLPSDFTPLRFLMVYLPWMAYRGTDNLFVKKNKVNKFVFVSSAMLLGVPLFLQFILSKF